MEIISFIFGIIDNDEYTNNDTAVVAQVRALLSGDVGLNPTNRYQQY